MCIKNKVSSLNGKLWPDHWYMIGYKTLLRHIADRMVRLILEMFTWNQYCWSHGLSCFQNCLLEITIIGHMTWVAFITVYLKSLLLVTWLELLSKLFTWNHYYWSHDLSCFQNCLLEITIIGHMTWVAFKTVYLKSLLLVTWLELLSKLFTWNHYYWSHDLSCFQNCLLEITIIGHMTWVAFKTVYLKSLLLVTWLELLSKTVYLKSLLLVTWLELLSKLFTWNHYYWSHDLSCFQNCLLEINTIDNMVCINFITVYLKSILLVIWFCLDQNIQCLFSKYSYYTSCIYLDIKFSGLSPIYCTQMLL